MAIKLHGTYIEKAGENVPYDMVLEYYLTDELLCEKYSDLKRYGIMIKKTATFDDGTTKEETKQIKDVFYRLCDAEEFLDMLIRGKVTPMALEDIVGEYIESKLRVVG